MYCAVCGLYESLKKDCTSCYKIARLVLPADPRESATFAASALPLADHSAVVVETCLRSLIPRRCCRAMRMATQVKLAIHAKHATQKQTRCFRFTHLNS